MNEDELRRMLQDQTPDPAAGGEWASTAVRAGRRRRTVRRLGAVGATVVVVAAAVVGAQALPRTLTAPAPPAATSPPVTASPIPTGTVPTATGPAPSATAVTSPPVTAPASVDVIVAGGQGAEAAVYAIAGGSHTATVQRELHPPETDDGPIHLVDVAIASGADPLACAVWSIGAHSDALRGGVTELSCYAPGSSRPVRVVGPQDAALGPDDHTADDVALRPDGSAVAWSDGVMGGNGAVSVAQLDGVEVGAPTTWTADPGKPRGSGEGSTTGVVVNDLAFAGDSGTLVVTVVGDSSRGLSLLDTSTPGGSWAAGPLLAPAAAPGVHDRYLGVASATADTAWAVLGSDFEQQDPDLGDRAVLVSLRDGRVLDTLVVPGEGRAVSHVSGSADGIVFCTWDPFPDDRVFEQERTYLRRSTEESGTTIEGLARFLPVLAIGP